MAPAPQPQCVGHPCGSLPPHSLRPVWRAAHHRPPPALLPACPTMPAAMSWRVFMTSASEFTWSFWAPPDPPSPARSARWLHCAARGAAKRARRSEYIRNEVESGRHRSIAIVGPTASAIRRDMVEAAVACSPSRLHGAGPDISRAACGLCGRTAPWRICCRLKSRTEFVV